VRVLGVDFGEKRVGLAVSDEAGSVVVPVGAIQRKNDAQAAAAVTAAAQEREVTRIVVGHPLRPDGSEGTSAVRTRLFARRLAEVSGIPVDLHGEGLTTVAAEHNLLEAGVPTRRREGARDAEAAAVLLRDYLSAGRDPDADR
jgi:putative Holliday junction resolvase